MSRRLHGLVVLGPALAPRLRTICGRHPTGLATTEQPLRPDDPAACRRCLQLAGTDRARRGAARLLEARRPDRSCDRCRTRPATVRAPWNPTAELCAPCARQAAAEFDRRDAWPAPAWSVADLAVFGPLIEHPAERSRTR